MQFEYVAWGSGEIVVRVLRALSRLAVSGELAGALQAAALFGLLVMLAVAALRPGVEAATGAMKLILAAILCGGILLLPTNVLVTDRFGGQDLLDSTSRSVAGDVLAEDIPLGVAFPLALSSALGTSMTRVIETAMRDVEEDRLSSAGLWLSARALRAMAQERRFRDPTLAVDFRYFLENCTYFDALSNRVSLENLLTRSPMSELGQTSGGLTSVHDANGDLVPASCPIAWGGGANAYGVQVSGLSERLVTEGVIRKFEACQSLRGISLAMNHVDLAVARNEALDPTTGASASCGDRVFNHALQKFGYQVPPSVSGHFAEMVAIGLLREGAHLLSSQDPKSIALARYTAQRQREATYVVAGELAAVALPVLRGLLEVVVLALMPFLMVIGLMYFEQLGMYLKNGLALVLWLQLWLPVMAVINNVGQWVQVAAMNEHVILANGSFTLAQVEAMHAELDTQLALSRYMLVLAPMIAWSLVRAGEFGGAMLSARLLQPGEQAATAASSHAASNNWSMDQVQLAPRTSVGPHVATIGDEWGGTVTRHERMETMSLPANEPGYVSAAHSRSITESLSRRAEESASHAQERRVQLAQSVENAYESAYGAQGLEALGTLRERGVSDETSLRALQGMGEMSRLAESKGRSVDQSGASEHSWKFGVKGGATLPMPVSIGADVTSSSSHREGVSESMRRGYDQLDEESKSAMREVGTVLRHTEHGSASTSHSRVNSEGHKATMREAQSDLEAYSETEQRASRLATAADVARTTGQTVVRELARDPANSALLSEFHRLHNVEGEPFERAWSQAQENTGTMLDMDALTSRLVGQEESPMPVKVREPGHATEQYADNRRRVEMNATGGELGADPGIEAAKEELRGELRRIAKEELPQPGEDHYQDDRAIDRDVLGPDGQRVMVIPGESLLLLSDQRTSEVFSQLIDDITGGGKPIVEEEFDFNAHP